MLKYGRGAIVYGVHLLCKSAWNEEIPKDRTKASLFPSLLRKKETIINMVIIEVSVMSLQLASA